MTGPEIAQAPRYGLDPIVLVMNNGGWQIFRPVVAARELLDVPPWPYAQLARALGWARATASSGRTSSATRSRRRRACRTFVLIEALRPTRRSLAGDAEVHRGLGAARARGGGRDHRPPPLRRPGARLPLERPRGVQLRRARSTRGRRIGAASRSTGRTRPAGRERLTFWDVRQASNRCMNALAGARRRPRRSGHGHAAARARVAGGDHRRRSSSARSSIPCTASLRAKDIALPGARTAARARSSRRSSRSPEVDAALAGTDGLPDPRRARRRARRLARLRTTCSPGGVDGGVPARTRSDEPALCFYTSGTTKDPKAVLHTHGYTFAHRYTGEYWLDLQRTDLHWTTSDTGWAKAAYGVLFGPVDERRRRSSCSTAASIPRASSTCSRATRSRSSARRRPSTACW